MIDARQKSLLTAAGSPAAVACAVVFFFGYWFSRSRA